MTDPEFGAIVEAQKKIVERSKQSKDKIVSLLTSNPEEVKSIAEQHKLIGGKVILEIGHGGKFCVDVPNKSVVVGVEPMTDPNTSRTDVKKGSLSERVFFNSGVENLPTYLHPDVVVVVAPSPEDYQEIFVELLDKIDQKTKTILFIENQSIQAKNGDSKRMSEYYSQVFLQRNMSVDVDTEVMDLEEDFDSFLHEVGLTGSLSSFWNETAEWVVVTGQPKINTTS